MNCKLEHFFVYFVLFVCLFYKLEHSVVFPLSAKTCIRNLNTTLFFHYKRSHELQTWTQCCLSITSIECMNYKLELNVVFPLPAKTCIINLNTTLSFMHIPAQNACALQTWTQRCLSIINKDMHQKLEHNNVFPLTT